QTVALWIDLHVPISALPGEYVGRIDLFEEGSSRNGPRAVGSLPLKLTVYDFVLPDERHLQMVGQLSWDRLVKLFPERFEAITARLMNRRDSRYTAAVKTLDQ